MEVGTYFTIFIKILSLFFRKKNKNTVYINSNVKLLNIEDIRPLIRPSDSAIVNFQSRKNSDFKTYRRHLFFQKVRLYPIYKKIQDSSSFTYCGFPSQMFAVFDGFVLGNTTNYNFFELDKKNQYYKLSFKKNYKKEIKKIPESDEILNVVVETSYKIDRSKLAQVPCVEFSEQQPERINNEFLNKVYSFVKNVLDNCCNTKIKTVNLYMTCKPSVAFIIGTAIENFHPNIRIFNYDNNDFLYYLDLKNGKLMKKM